MPDAAIALGSNLGNRTQNLHQAVHRVGALGRVMAVSKFIETVPVGYLGQPDFVNGVLRLKTDVPALALMQALLAIEQAMGRDRGAGVPAKGPRVIDLDLLLYDDLVLTKPELTLPHPEMHRRAFVLGPLAEIAAEWVHPGLRISVRELFLRVQTHEASEAPA